MMKKIGIITINDNNNYGNRLQNYAVQESVKKIQCECVTIKNDYSSNNKKNFIIRNIKLIIKKILKINGNLIPKKRIVRFDEFNKNIIFSNKKINPFIINTKKYDYFVVGSDQVWNPKFGRLSDIDLLSFSPSNKRIAFSASFGIKNVDEKYVRKARKELQKFKAISVREDRGKEIVEELTGRKDVEVLVDPTMLLTAEEWDKVSKKPEQLKCDKYILNYFLGELSESRKNEINRIAKENDCEVINILDKNSPFYVTGPSEFLYLEKNAFLICTDSFHSCVFAILYNRPFIVFEREENIEKMNSRIETLLSKFELKNREYSGKITEENLNCDYFEVYRILEKEREKSKKFLERALN